MCFEIISLHTGMITLMQMPQPIHRDSEIHTILLCGVTSMHSLPVNTHSSFKKHLSLVLVCAAGTLLSTLTHTDDRAALLALLTAFLRFAFVMVDDGDPGVLIRHGGGPKCRMSAPVELETRNRGTAGNIYEMIFDLQLPKLSENV